MAANPITYYIEVLSPPPSRTADIVTQVITKDGTCNGRKAPFAATGPAGATPLLGGAAVAPFGASVAAAGAAGSAGVLGLG